MALSKREFKQLLCFFAGKIPCDSLHRLPWPGDAARLPAGTRQQRWQACSPPWHGRLQAVPVGTTQAAGCGCTPAAGGAPCHRRAGLEGAGAGVHDPKQFGIAGRGRGTDVGASNLTLNLHLLESFFMTCQSLGLETQI